MAKNEHEIRDPIHNFIRLESSERRVLDSRPMQRLRHIHQLGTTFLVYPGATHRRFEHSLGVMELASRVYDIVMHPNNVHDSVKNIIPEHGKLEYHRWRRTLRMAALCHDIGHLPFSHAAEAELLPQGWDHERLTIEIIKSNELKKILERVEVDPVKVAWLAVGQKKYPDQHFSDLETLLSEIIVGDAFGVDRMDYLLRDSHHAGVAYGRFDHYRLIDSLRILPFQKGQGNSSKSGASKSAMAAVEEDSTEPSLGLHEDGIHGAEALLVARYFMYTQLYFHPVRRAYDRHLQDFLAAYLPEGKFSTKVIDHLRTTDNELMAAILESAQNKHSPSHAHATCLVNRGHFRQLYHTNPEDQKRNPNAAVMIFESACREFGEENLKFSPCSVKGQGTDFPVLMKDGRISRSLLVSEMLAAAKPVVISYVLIHPELKDRAEKWLNKNRNNIITSVPEVNDDGTP
ncbi:MAG: HD domain-containing protein [Terriglobia bacterium]